MTETRGKIVEFETEATHDEFANADIIHLTIETEDGKRTTVRYRPDGGVAPSWRVCDNLKDNPDEIFALDARPKTDAGRTYRSDPYTEVTRDTVGHYHFSSFRVRPALGDTVVVCWNYDSCRASLIALADDRSRLIEWAYPVTKERDASINDVIEHLCRSED